MAINSWSTPLRRSAWTRAWRNCQSRTASPTNIARMMKTKQSVKRGPMLIRWKSKVFPLTFFVRPASCAHTVIPIALLALCPIAGAHGLKQNITRDDLLNPFRYFLRDPGSCFGRRSFFDPGYLNQFLLQGCGSNRWTLFLTQRRMHRLDVRSGHILILRPGNY